MSAPDFTTIPLRPAFAPMDYQAWAAKIKKETGMNFSAYLVHIRMEIAKEMIRSSNKTVAAIAEGVGYKDVRHFSQTFTKTVGVKPALYRKLYS